MPQRFVIIGFTAFFLAAYVCLAQSQSNGAPATSSSPQLTHFSLDNLDPKTDPCVDFYQYACGGWMASHPIPAGQAFWDALSALQDRTESILRDIAERSASADPKRDVIHQKLGDYYAACMDERHINTAGTEPIEAELRLISNIKERADIAAELGHLDRLLYLSLQGSIFPSTSDPGSREPLFGFSPIQDYRDASKVVAFVDQGGLGLPTRDYYLKDDKESVEIRNKYVAHVGNMLGLLKLDTDPHKAANQVMEIETALARSWMDAVTRRDRKNLNNRYSPAELQRLMPNFDWARFLVAVGAPPSDHYLVASPDFFRTVNSLLGSESIDAWKTYLRWNLVRASAPFLSQDFAAENFDFYSRVLTGANEIPPRWKRCIWATDRDLQDALGRVFVEQSFHEDDKQYALQIVKEIEDAFDGVIKEADWFSPTTQTLARAKLSMMTRRAGYPDRWRDYSSLHITRESWAANAFRSSEYELARQLDHIGKPVDRAEWWTTVTTILAYNNPRQNSVTFTAGILGPPLFDRAAPDAMSLGAFGALAGHEITHGFDSMGRKYDASGNLQNWWTAEDDRQFEERSKCIVDQYSAYVVVDNAKINGQLTLSENIADGGGVRLAYRALQNRMKASPTVNKTIDGFTPEQQFFLAYALPACSNATPEALKLYVSSDEHSPPKQHVNGVVSNMPEFQQAFHCKLGQPMVRANACRVW